MNREQSRTKNHATRTCQFWFVLFIGCLQILFLVVVNIRLFLFNNNHLNDDLPRDSFQQSLQKMRKESFFYVPFESKRNHHRHSSGYEEERDGLREEEDSSGGRAEDNEEFREEQEEQRDGEAEAEEISDNDEMKVAELAEPEGRKETDGEKAEEEEEEERLAGLSCEKHGGPSNELAREVVYWRDIPSDSRYVSPFHKKHQEQQHEQEQQQRQYLTFEMDRGGWNNKRMALETIIAMAFATGRTLVIPAEQPMYQIDQGQDPTTGKDQRVHFSFHHFFPLESIHREHPGLDIITMEEFLQREAMAGNLRKHNNDSRSRVPAFPPNNRTKWDGCHRIECKELYLWLRTVSRNIHWNYKDCIAAFPKTTEHHDIQALVEMKDKILGEGFPPEERYIGNPLPVNARTIHRMSETLSNRTSLCLYDEEVREEPVIHFPVDPAQNDIRYLVHFYSFLFFQDWKQDLWMKRFIRDHVRYIDEIQCAAARIVHAIRQRARQRQPDNKRGVFDTMHVRRTDFQSVYRSAFVKDANAIYNAAKSQLTANDTVYIATDEKHPKTFFKPLMEHYDVVFLGDFKHLVRDINTNYYGMVEQVVASRGRVFFGCWFSTFTGYINRMRGHHSQKEKLPGYEHGIIDSWYYIRERDYGVMRKYYPMKREFSSREWPPAWRLIDTDVE